ncbi:MAG: transglycosylase SLT domain-containing protein [Candidatus Margulisbacteria bacterium]|nr:transglycosylase SLT domain-containing protein [Candidatus Margulisiibacteriota bacterium]
MLKNIFFVLFVCFAVILASDVSNYKDGKQLLKTGEYQKAYLAFHDIGEGSVLYPYSSYYEAYCALRGKLYNEAASANIYPASNEKLPFSISRKNLKNIISYYHGEPQTPEQLIWLGKHFFEQGNYNEAVKCFESIPTTSSIDSSIPLYVARCSLVIGTKNRTLELFSALPNSAEKFYYSAVLHDEEEKKFMYDQILENYPESSLASDAAFYLYTDAKKKKNFEKAFRYLDFLEKTGKYKNMTYFERGILLYTQNDYYGALEAFKNSEADVYQEASLYWQAKCLEKLDKADISRQYLLRLQTLYPYSYYSYRAFFQTEYIPDISDIKYSPADIPAEDVPQRLKKLLAAEAFDDAIYELTSYYNIKNNRNLWEYYANQAIQKKQYYYVYRSYEGIKNNYLAYPLVYMDLIEQRISADEVDPYLVLALIRGESSYNPEAVSYSGAVGLMQLMPATAAAIASKIKLENYSLRNPSDNITMGMLHLKYYLKTIGVIKGVAVYNCGIGNMTRNFNNFDDIDLYVENIPIGQTRGYVKKVLGNYWVYKLLYDRNSKNPIMF